MRHHGKLYRERLFFDKVQSARARGARTIYKALRYCMRVRLESRRQKALHDIAKPMLK